MAQIVLEVADEAAIIYNSLSHKQRQKFNLVICLMLKKILNDSTFSDYSKLLDEIGEEATKNGLTPEILESLLASED